MLSVAVSNAIKLAHAVMSKDEFGSRNVERMADKLAMQNLGRGYYSTVFEHAAAPGLAIKTCTNRNETCVTYLAWARANPGPHVPRVHYVSRLSGGGYVAVLDRLYALDADNSRTFSREVYEYGEGNYGDNDHPLAVATQRIYSFFEDIAGWDLHMGNAMQTINREIVITDPITQCNSGSGDLRTGIERAFGVAEAA